MVIGWPTPMRGESKRNDREQNWRYLQKGRARSSPREIEGAGEHGFSEWRRSRYGIAERTTKAAAEYIATMMPMAAAESAIECPYTAYKLEHVEPELARARWWRAPHKRDRAARLLRRALLRARTRAAGKSPADMSSTPAPGQARQAHARHGEAEMVDRKAMNSGPRKLDTASTRL